jgi:hypothetical protein
MYFESPVRSSPPGDAFEHGGARPGTFSVRFHRLQGILDLVGDAPFGFFVGMAVAVPRTFFVLFGIRVLCLGVLVGTGVLVSMGVVLVPASARVEVCQIQLVRLR